MTDYIACGRVVPERIAAIVRGIAEACAQAGAALVGGETAEHPGLLGPDEYDVAGAATGVVEADALLGPDRVRAGDVAGRDGFVGPALQRLLAGAPACSRSRAGRSSGTCPSSAGPWARSCSRRRGCTPGPAWPWPAAARVHALSHVTGGGLAANLRGCCPRACVATVDRCGWQVPPVFDLVRRLGQVPWTDLEGPSTSASGWSRVLPPEAVDDALRLLAAAGTAPWVLGEVTQETGMKDAAALVRGTKGVAGGAVRLTGSYRV